MKILKIIVALLILTSFTYSCTPQAINEDSDTIENKLQATGDDGEDDTDDSRDNNGGN